MYYTFITLDGRTYEAMASQNPQDVGIPNKPATLSDKATFDKEKWEWLEYQPTPEEIEKQFSDALQKYMDDFAKTRKYEDIGSACSYAVSQTPQLKMEGMYCVVQRDAIWIKSYEILTDVLAGKRPMPTREEVMAEMPVLEWPVLGKE